MFSISLSPISRQKKGQIAENTVDGNMRILIPACPLPCCVTLNNSLDFSHAHLSYLEKQEGWAKATFRCLPGLKSKMLMAHSVFKDNVQCQREKSIPIFVFKNASSGLPWWRSG